MRRLTPLALVALLLASAGCDSVTDPAYDNDFFVGSWTLVSVSDDSGEISTEVFSEISSLDIEFGADQSFTLDVDFPDSDNDSQFTGTYNVIGQTIVLTASGFAPTFTISDAGSGRVGLSAPDIILQALLAGTDLDLDGTVTLVVRRV